MHSPEAIFEQLKKILVELFEIDPGKITNTANLYEDLDIDSIDAIDLILQLKELTGRKFQPEDFKQVRTVNDVIAAVQQLMARSPAGQA